jgi:transposase InsO family protein
MMDVSEVRPFLGPTLFIAAAFDAFSRAPLAVQTFAHKPCALEMAVLLKRAAGAFTKPKYLMTDCGGEFIGGAFKAATAYFGTKHRFALKENLYATARLERFWRTLKESARLYRLGLPMTRSDLERRLEIALAYYVAFRPHEGLNGMTPLEALLGLEPGHVRAVEPPRGAPGQRAAPAPFALAFLDDDRRFPILTRVA